jgi:putative Holliday junction resolvase
MPLFNMADLRAALPRHTGARAGPGGKIIGVALSDVTLMLASPYGSMKRGKLKVNAAEIAAICAKEGAGGLLVGLPLGMDGSAAPRPRRPATGPLALSDATGLPVACGTSGSPARP